MFRFNAFFDRFRDHGLLLVRVGIGLTTALLHGWGKMAGGPEVWNKVGGAMAMMGIDFAPTFWGFMAALAEFGGGLLVALGLLVRPAAAMVAFTMVVATVMHLANGDALGHSFDLLVVYVGLVLAGGGRFSLDAKLFGARNELATA